VQVAEATEAEILQEQEDEEDEESYEEQSEEQSAEPSAHAKKKKGISAVLRRKLFRPLKHLLRSPKKLVRKCKYLK
jgi:hypothetical protein